MAVENTVKAAKRTPTGGAFEKRPSATRSSRLGFWVSEVELGPRNALESLLGLRQPLGWPSEALCLQHNSIRRFRAIATAANTPIGRPKVSPTTVPSMPQPLCNTSRAETFPAMSAIPFAHGRCGPLLLQTSPLHRSLLRRGPRPRQSSADDRTGHRAMRQNRYESLQHRPT